MKTLFTFILLSFNSQAFAFDMNPNRVILCVKKETTATNPNGFRSIVVERETARTSPYGITLYTKGEINIDNYFGAKSASIDGNNLIIQFSSAVVGQIVDAKKYQETIVIDLAKKTALQYADQAPQHKTVFDQCKEFSSYNRSRMINWIEKTLKIDLN